MKTRVAELRRERGWTQADLAHRANCAQSSVSRLEAGDLNATLKTMADVAGALGVTVPDLFSPPLPSEVKDLADQWKELSGPQRAMVTALLDMLEDQARGSTG